MHILSLSLAQDCRLHQCKFNLWTTLNRDLSSSIYGRNTYNTTASLFWGLYFIIISLWSSSLIEFVCRASFSTCIRSAFSFCSTCSPICLEALNRPNCVQERANSKRCPKMRSRTVRSSCELDVSHSVSVRWSTMASNLAPISSLVNYRHVIRSIWRWIRFCKPSSRSVKCTSSLPIRVWWSTSSNWSPVSV